VAHLSETKSDFSSTSKKSNVIGRTTVQKGLAGTHVFTSQLMLQGEQVGAWLKFNPEAVTLPLPLNALEFLP
jgi:hypothetical protein